MERVHFIRKDTGLILLRVNHRDFKGGRFNYSTGQKVSAQNWQDGALKRDQPTQWVKPYPKLRHYLEALRAACERHCAGEVSEPKLREELAAVAQGGPRRRGGLYETWAHIIETTKSSNGMPIKKSSKSAKTQSLNKCMEFDPDLTFSGITIDFYHRYYAWLEKETPRSVGKHLKELKAFLNECIERDIPVPLDFKKKSFRAPKLEPDSTYLSESELTHLFNTKVAPHLEKTRDMFIVAAFTGQRWGDWPQLAPHNVEGNVIRVTQQKTGETVYLPIHPFVRAVWNKYDGLPEILTNQKFNLALKEVCVKAKLGKVALNGALVEKSETISTHTARRSFASNCYLGGLEVLAIRKLTGHRTEKSFMRYIKLDNKSHGEKAGKHSFFNPQMKAA